MAPVSCHPSSKYYEHSWLFDINLGSQEGLSNFDGVFSGCVTETYYIANKHELLVYDRDNCPSFGTCFEEEIIAIYGLPELDSLLLKFRGDTLKIFNIISLTFMQLPLQNFEDIKIISWANGFLDVVIVTSDSKEIILRAITKESFNNSVLHDDSQLFSRILQTAVIRRCISPLSLVCPSENSSIATAISLQPSLKVLTFENSMANQICEQDILCFSALDELESSSIKREFLGSGYFAILTLQRRLLIFNAIARVYCGPLSDTSDVIDFAVKLRTSSKNSLSFDLYTLHDRSGEVVLEVHSYPGWDHCFSLPLSTKLSSIFSRNDSNLEPLLVQQMGTSLKLSTFVVTDPLEHLKVLVVKKAFVEARQFAAKYNLSTTLIAKFEFIACLECMIKLAEKLVNCECDGEMTTEMLSNAHSTCSRALELLGEFPVLEPSSEILLLVQQGIIPRLKPQSQLLKQMLLKLPKDSEGSEAVAASLKRLQVFQKLKKHCTLSCNAWRKFAFTKISVEFVECFIKWENYYDGFLIWSAFKDELTADLTESSLRSFLSLISQKPLLVPSGSIEDLNYLAEVENKLHSWLSSELLPALLSNCPSALPILSNWVVDRTHQLEASMKMSGVVHAPFKWPGTAIVWIENLLRRSTLSITLRPEEITPQEEVNYLISGLSSRNLEVDPFYSLRGLLFDLRTIEDLHDKYNFSLDLAHCDNLNVKSIAFKLMDVTVSSHSTTDSSGSDSAMEKVASFIKERGLNADKVYSEYCTYFLANLVRTFKADEENASPSKWNSTAVKESARVVDLSRRACLVASWIKSLDYRCKTAQLLAKVTPTPWPSQLHAIVDSVLADCSKGKSEDAHPAIRKLTRRSNVAKAIGILSKYGVELDNPDGSISCLLFRALPPWIIQPTSKIISPEISRSEVLSDALLVARLLTSSADTASKSPNTLVALAHLRISLRQALTLPLHSERYSVDIHQRVDYLRSVVLKEVMTLKPGGDDDFVELIFREAIHELGSLWELTRCDLEQVSQYLEVFVCIALDATKVCPTNSSVAKDASQWLHYCHLGRKILSHFEVCGISLSHFPKPNEASPLNIVFYQFPTSSPFSIQSIALFHLLLQWNNRQFSQSDEEILLVDTWLSLDHSRSLETVVTVLKQLVDRVKIKPVLESISGDVVYGLILHKIMPFLTAAEIESDFNLVSDLIRCIYVLLIMASNKGVLSSKLRCVLSIVSCVETVFSKLALKFSSVIPSRSPFETWQFSLLFHEKVLQNVDLDTAQFLSSDSLQWLSQILHYANRKTNDARTVHGLLSEGFSLATDYATRLSLITTVSIPLMGSLVSLCYEEVHDGSLRTADVSLHEESQFELPRSAARRDLLEELERILVDQVDSWMGEALDNLFRSSSYLDVPLAFGLAVSQTLTNSANRMRAIVANNPRASSKIQAIAAMMYKASRLLRAEDAERMVAVAMGLALNAKWDAALRPYGLRLSHRNPQPAEVLDHLIRILPPVCRSVSVTDPLSTPLKPLPSVSEIVDFCKDFHQNANEALLKHLEILIMAPFSETPSSAIDEELCRFKKYSRAKLDRASEVYRVLLRIGSTDVNFMENRLGPSIKRLFSSISPYDYEQLSFLLDCIKTLDDLETVSKFERLLAFLQRYQLNSSRSNQFNIDIGIASPSQEEISFNSILEKYRLPFHPLCVETGLKFFEKDINQANLYKWLQLNEIVEWFLSDKINIAMIANGLGSLEKIGLLRVHSKSSLFPSANPATAQFFRHTVPVDRAAADIWEHASACERIFRVFFKRAFKILSRIGDRELLLKFLGETFSSFRDGPIKLIFLDMVVMRILSEWLGGGRESSSYSHTSVIPPNDGSDSALQATAVVTGPVVQGRLSDRFKESTSYKYWGRALEEAELCYQKLAVEACLHRHNITRFWPDILTRAVSSSVLVDLLLNKACAIYASSALIDSSRIDPTIGDIIAYHRREDVLSQLRCAIKELLSLQGVSFTVWARQVVWQRLRLPKSIRLPEWPETSPTGGTNLMVGDGEGVDLNATAIVFDLDSSVLMPGEQGDLSLNATFAASPISSYNAKDDLHRRGNISSESEENEFILGEFLIAEGSEEDLRLDVVRVLAEWCLLRPLTPAVLQALSTQEIQRRWRTLRLTLRCRKLPLEDECPSSTLIEYLNGIAARARVK
nr:kinetochore associated protein 1 [Hymenolepis microstoma]